MQTLKKIPKRPFYRIVRFGESLLTMEETQGRLLEVRKRLWKMNSYHQRDQRILDGSWNLREIFYSLTMKKSLKNVKRLSFLQPADYLSERFFRWISCALDKVESLRIEIPHYLPLRTPFYQRINPNIQKCFFKFQHNGMKTLAYEKILPKFRRFRKCLLYTLEVQEDSLVLKAEKIKSVSIPFQWGPVRDYLLVNPECIEKICTPIFGQDNPIDLPLLLPNLKVLKLLTVGKYDSHMLRDFSFLEKYQALESLHLSLAFVEADTLDFLQKLTKLKSFHLISNKGRDRKGPIRKIPILTGLEHLGLYLGELYKPNSMFDIENIKDAILSNKNLKSLELGLDLKAMEQVFSENLLLKIEKLVIVFYESKPYSPTEKIITFLRNNSQIKSLEISFPKFDPDLSNLFFKPIGTIDCLEELKLNYIETGRPEDNNLDGIKDALPSNSRLTSFELYLGTEELNDSMLHSLMDALIQLKHLEKFAIRGFSIKPIKTSLFVKFANFIKNARHMRKIDIAIKGFAQEDIDQLNELIGTKYSLSNKRDDHTRFFEY